jgi:hypothetical protein
MERQQWYAIHLGISEGSAAILTDNLTIGRLSSQKCFRGHRDCALAMSANGA